MNYEQIKLIDFSQGIRSAEVYRNDLALQEQIERERLAIAGYGINYGLNLTLLPNNMFSLQVTNGTLVDKEGKEKYINNKNFEIERPKLISKRQKVYSEQNGKIALEDIPYSINRDMPSQYAEKKYWNIEIYYEDNPSYFLNISAIDKNIIYTDAANINRAIIVNYATAYDRIDTVYINSQYNIDVKCGISSNTPSAYIPEDNKYILGFIKVLSKSFNNIKDILEAKTSIIEEFDNRRTVYTDLNNKLYLCGTPFESLLKIYFEEPKQPKEGMLWYDMTTNKLRIWRKTDFFVFSDVYTYTSSDPNNPQLFDTSVGYFEKQLSVYINKFDSINGTWKKLTPEEIELYTDLDDNDKDIVESKQFRIVPKLIQGNKIKYAINRYDESYYWVPINDTSYIPAFECKMWCPNKNEDNLLEYLPGLTIDELMIDRDKHDFKHFLFKQNELHLRYTPYKNELNIIINQIPLHRDQFNEITVNDILNSSELTNLAINSYGYTIKELEELKNEYLDIGLGFKFVNKLDKPCFIEVDITHRVNDSILKNKLLRNATFSKSETIIYDSTKQIEIENTLIITTLIPYKYGEEQLDVYINGKRIKKELITEISNTKILGSNCKSFSINKDNLALVHGDEISYKITTNVYSYDHVESAMKELNKELYDKIRELENEIDKIKNQ